MVDDIIISERIRLLPIYVLIVWTYVVSKLLCLIKYYACFDKGQILSYANYVYPKIEINLQ